MPSQKESLRLDYVPVIWSNMGMNIQTEIELAVRSALELAVEFFQLNLKEIPILFTIPHYYDAIACLEYTDGFNAEDCVLMFDLEWAKKNKEVCLTELVPHEVAHYVDRMVYGTAHENEHGKTWQLIKTHIYALEPKECYG